MIVRVAVFTLGLLAQLGASAALAQERVYTSDAGMLFHPILPTRTADFEKVIDRVREALRNSTDETRQQQARSWKVYQAVEPGPFDSVLYIFMVDPALTDADYTIGEILREELPLEAQALYETFASCYAYSPSLLNLRLVTDFGVDPADTPVQTIPQAAP